MKLVAIRDNLPEIVRGKTYEGKRRWPGDPYFQIQDPRCLAHAANFVPAEEEEKHG